MAKRTSIFDFLRIKHLTQVGDFSPSVDSGATVDHYNDLKLYFLVMNLIVEFNELSKSGLGVVIGLARDIVYFPSQNLQNPNFSKNSLSHKLTACVLFFCETFLFYRIFSILLRILDNAIVWIFNFFLVTGLLKVHF
jgi:hypothetical protein